MYRHLGGRNEEASREKCLVARKFHATVVARWIAPLSFSLSLTADRLIRLVARVFRWKDLGETGRQRGGGVDRPQTVTGARNYADNNHYLLIRVAALPDHHCYYKRVAKFNLQLSSRARADVTHGLGCTDAIRSLLNPRRGPRSPAQVMQYSNNNLESFVAL